MADVAQLVEPSVVVRVVAGSNPVVRPIFLIAVTFILSSGPVKPMRRDDDDYL